MPFRLHHNVLFLCTANSARSQLAEALMNVRQGRHTGFSAGSHPSGVVNPLALAKIRALGLDPAAFRSKSWDEFAQPGAPEMDVVITVCDAAAGEACPIWPGNPIRAHWPFPDPRTPAEFDAVYAQIADKIERFFKLPWNALGEYELQAAIRSIGIT